MKLSSRAHAATESPTLGLTAKVNALKAAGEDIVGFTAGEPDFDTPEHIKEAAREALARGLTKYTPTAGTVGLRAAIVEKTQRDSGLTYEPKQVIVGCGGKHVLYLIFQALLDPGDAVLIPAPYWVSYVDQTRLAGGAPLIVPTVEADDFKLQPAQLDAVLALNPHVRALILNSPSNPTGATYSAAELAALAAVLERYPQVVVIADEIYEHLTYGGVPFASIAQVPGFQARTVIVNGCSKAYSMTGWRIGWALGDAALIGAMTRIASHETSNPTTIAQAGAEAALRGDQSAVETMRRAFEARRTLIVDGLRALPGVQCLEPTGAFYVFPNIAAHLGAGETADEFAARLLEASRVAVVPGNGFGAPDCVRLSYACSEANITAGLSRLAAFLGA
ncbi:MAG TPA: aspartate aminotransferase [Armatimonadetes bacterium]|nr:aspartate aminotransferase [Armatimonadota bacterium]